jgi:hypothetical protein
VALDHGARDAAGTETRESFGQGVFVTREDDVLLVSGVHVAALDPARPRKGGAGRGRFDENAVGKGHAVAGEEGDRALAVGVANSRGAVDDARPALSHAASLSTIGICSHMTKRKQRDLSVGRRLGKLVRRLERDVVSARTHLLGGGSQDLGVVGLAPG